MSLALAERVFVFTFRKASTYVYHKMLLKISVNAYEIDHHHHHK